MPRCGELSLRLLHALLVAFLTISAGLHQAAFQCTQQTHIAYTEAYGNILASLKQNVKRALSWGTLLHIMTRLDAMMSCSIM